MSDTGFAQIRSGEYAIVASQGKPESVIWPNRSYTEMHAAYQNAQTEVSKKIEGWKQREAYMTLRALGYDREDSTLLSDAIVWGPSARGLTS